VPAVEARLVGRDDELGVDARDALALGDEQPRQVLGEMAPLRLVGEHDAELFDGVLHDGRELDDGRHTQALLSCKEPLACL
jgi:hypothetical protein